MNYATKGLIKEATSLIKAIEASGRMSDGTINKAKIWWKQVNMNEQKKREAVQITHPPPPSEDGEIYQQDEKEQIKGIFHGNTEMRTTSIKNA